MQLEKRKAQEKVASVIRFQILLQCRWVIYCHMYRDILALL